VVARLCVDQMEGTISRRKTEEINSSGLTIRSGKKKREAGDIKDLVNH